MITTILQSDNDSFPALGACAILKRTTKGGNNMAAILMIDDERAILELVKNGAAKGWAFRDRLYLCRTGTA